MSASSNFIDLTRSQQSEVIDLTEEDDEGQLHVSLLDHDPERVEQEIMTMLEYLGISDSFASAVEVWLNGQPSQEQLHGLVGILSQVGHVHHDLHMCDEFASTM